LIFAVLLAAASARPLLSNQFGNDQIGGVEKQGFEKFPGVSGKSLDLLCENCIDRSSDQT
jgi:hypothetical protein